MRRRAAQQQRGDDVLVAARGGVREGGAPVARLHVERGVRLDQPLEQLGVPCRRRRHQRRDVPRVRHVEVAGEGDPRGDRADGRGAHLARRRVHQLRAALDRPQRRRSPTLSRRSPLQCLSLCADLRRDGEPPARAHERVELCVRKMR
ncbi:hypothetical protein AB1Y20_000537 [Prymnesium parvum]|uniref:Uncharacterized protein n=1 Tax=Prymnesium parvum TaxID=97485 RepID=A0AB34K6U5_PRYPA